MGRWRGVELNDLLLTGSRLQLRPWQLADAPAVHAVMQEPRMHAYLPLPDPYTEQEAQQFVTTHAAKGRAAGRSIEAAVVETATATVVGSAALNLPTSPEESAEVGYWIAPPAQGRGYAAEAARTLAEWALAHDVGRVQIFCAVPNLGSAGAALAAGFTFEAIHRRAERTPSGPMDRAVFARLATDSGAPVSPVRPRLKPGELSDGVIALRVIEPGDAAQLLAEAQDGEARRWAFTDTVSPADEFVRVAARSGLEWLVTPMGRLAIVDVASGQFAGTMQLRMSGPPQLANVGYGIQAAFRGRGYTSRALRLLSAWVFAHTDIHRLELGAKAANIASQRAATNAGFHEEGVGRARLRNSDGTFSDERLYAMLRPSPRR
jgi:RimJ/RimL family protein N-acetyltransferase